MVITEFYIALLVGLLLSLAVEEFFGISSGGVIVAGYLSMVCDDLLSIGSCTVDFSSDLSDC